MTDWLTIADRVSDFTLQDASLDGWQGWYHRFKVVLKASSFDRLPNAQRVALLMMKCKGFLPAWELLEIDEDVIEYDDFVSKIRHYLNPTNARRVLSMRKQREDETFERFANDLEALSRPCHYTDEKIVRDFFIMNMHPSHAEVADAICQRDVSFEEAVAMAKSMVSQGRFRKEMEKSESMNGFCAPRPLSSLRKDSGNVNIRMVPIKPGTHEVLVLNTQPDKGICHVCPTGMLGARDDFLRSLNEWMENCKDPAVTPTKGARYAALMKCTWSRVDVLYIEGLQKKARVIATDFGWTWTAPFSVFRNLPLDFRPPDPLLWNVSVRTPMRQIEKDTILTVDIAYMDENWVASVIPVMNSDSSGSCMSYQSLLYNKPLGPNKPLSYDSESDVDLDQKTQQGGRAQGQDIHRGRSRSRSGRNRSRSEGRVLKESHTSSSAENSQKTLTSVDSRNRNFVQRTYDRQKVGRESFLDNQSEGRPRNSKLNNFNRGHTNGWQQSGYPTDSSSRSLAYGRSSAVKLVESDRHTNKRSDRGSNVSNRPHSSLCAESTSTSVDRSLGQIANGNFKRQENSSPRSTVDNSLESNNRGHNNNFTRGINNNVNERQLASEHELMTERQIPLGCFIKVHPVERSHDGKILYCVLESLMEECTMMADKLNTLEGLEPLEDLKIGALCLATDAESSLYRAKITRVHPSGEKVRVRFIDFGNEETRKVSELFALPDEYSRIQPFAFPVEVPSDLEVDPLQDLEVMAISRDEGSAWKIRIGGVEVASPAAAPPVVAAAAPPVGQRARKSSARGKPTPSPPPRPLHPPPIPRNAFTSITVVYNGPEGTFAVDSSKIGCLGEVQADINRMDLAPLEGVPEVHQLCVSPFQGELFRARVLEVQPNKCIVVFVDFGNEAVIPIRDMKRLPEELCDNIVTFKISLDPRSEVVLEEGMSLTVTPVVCGADGSWLVQLQGEPSPGPEHSLPDEDVL